MSRIQGDQIGFAQALAQAVEDGYQWKTSRGLQIAKTAILAIEYDEDTKALMSDVKKADALAGSRGNSFFQQAAARGMQSAGENGGGANMAFMGMGMNAAGNMMGGVKQPDTGNSYQPNFGAGQVNQNQAYNQGQNQNYNQGQANQGYGQGGQQNPNPNPNQNINQNPSPSQDQEDPTEKLIKMKKLLDAGVITEEEFAKMKSDLLGI